MPVEHTPPGRGPRLGPVGIRKTVLEPSPRHAIPVDNKLGLYWQCVGARKAVENGNAPRRRTADTACCTEPAYGDSIVSLCVERG